MLEQERNLQVSHDGGGEVRGHDWSPRGKGSGAPQVLCVHFFRGVN